MKRLLVTLVVLGVAMFSANLAVAGSLDNAKVGVHLKTHATKNWCTTNAPIGMACDAVCPGPGSSNLVVNGNVATNYDLYLIVLDIPTAVKCAGAAFGIQYPAALGIFGTNKCSDLEFPGQGWPASGGGNTFTFVAPGNCKGGVADPGDPQGEGIAVLYQFYVYAYGPAQFTLTPRNIATPDFTVADCSAAASNVNYPLFTGQAGFGMPGYQPCVPDCVPVETTTWGAIKKGLGE